MRAGGYHFTSTAGSEHPIYQPMSLPIRGYVSGTWGMLAEISSSDHDKEHDAYMQRHWGAKAIDVVNGAIETGQLIGDGAKRAALEQDEDRYKVNFTEESIDQMLDKARSEWMRDLQGGRLTTYQIEQGVDQHLQDRRWSLMRAIDMHKRAEKGVYRGSWSDVVHIRADAWDELVMPKAIRQKEKKINHQSQAYLMQAMSPFSRKVYEQGMRSPGLLDLAIQLNQFFWLKAALAPLLPSHIYHDDLSCDEDRAMVLAMASRLANARVSANSKQDDPNEE